MKETLARIQHYLEMAEFNLADIETSEQPLAATLDAIHKMVGDAQTALQPYVDKAELEKQRALD